MNKHIKRVLCLAVCLTTVFATSCDLLLESLLSSMPSSTSSHGDPLKNESSSSFGQKDSSEEEESSSGIEVELPPVEEPDPEKELIGKETDALGHEIARYSDGSWEDLGRVEPIDFTPKAPETKLGYQSLAKETGGDVRCAFYKSIYERAYGFFYSAKTVEADGYGYYSLNGVDISAYGLTMDELKGVWSTMKQDYPEFYWLANQIYTLGDTFFLCIDADYAEGSVRQTAQTAVQTSAMECDRYLNGMMSEGERALVIHDYLVADITYAYEEDGETPQDDAWAHNISGWALYDAGVCETYAETFTYLCDLFEVESSVVTGYAAQTGAMGGHAWNILCLDDEWYNVDVTWDDGYEKNDASLVGREWFGVPATEFARTHVADTPDGGLGGSYQFALPTLSEKSLSPVVFGEKYGEKTWCVSIDAAFEKMTNEGGMYEVKLYPTSQVLVDCNLTLYPSGARFTRAMPKVRELSFIGEFVYTDKWLGVGYMPDLTCASGLVLQGKLVLDCVDFSTPSLAENGYTYTCKNKAKVYLVTNV